MYKKIGRFAKVFPWYMGFSGDLLFYIAIDTLFLTMVKNFSPAQIVSLSSFAQFACIALQFPVLFIIKRIGNTASTRIGAVFLLFSAVCITFGRSYYLVLLGRIFHDVAAIFRSASTVMLENNLDLADSRHDFVRVRAAGNTVYSVVTMLISFVAGYLFNLNHYLPMFGCIACCAVGVVLSLLIKDYSNYNKISAKKEKKAKEKVNYSGFVIMAIVFCAIFFPTVISGQTEGKLFIQQEVLLSFDIDNTALIIGAIVCISRIIRVFSNVIFARAYKKYQAKMGIALPALLCVAIGFLFFGSFIPQILCKIAVMSAGYTIILFVRDPFQLYMLDVIFEHTPKEQHQTINAILDFGVKVGTAGMGLSFSAILMKFPMLVVMAIMFIIALIEIFLSIRLYKMVVATKEMYTTGSCSNF